MAVLEIIEESETETLKGIIKYVITWTDILVTHYILAIVG